MKLRLYSWVGFCWLMILIFVGCEWWVVSSVTTRLWAIIHPYSGIWVVVGLFILAVYREWKMYQQVHRDAIGAEHEAIRNPGLIDTYELVKDLLIALCQKRGIHVPLVYFQELHQSRNLVGMIDTPSKLDVVILHPELPHRVQFGELSAILAHELRHSNSLDNIFPILSRLFLRVLISLVAIAILAIILSSPFDPTLSIGQALGKSLAAVWTSFQAVFIVGPLKNWRSQFVEFKTDALSADDTGDPEALIGGLVTVEHLARQEHSGLDEILNHPLFQLLSTHPSLNARAKALYWIFRER